MSKLYKMNKLLLSILLSLGMLNVRAIPSINTFKALNQLTTENKLLISSTSATSVTFQIGISRQLSSGSTYENVLMSMYLVYKTSSSEEVLGGAYNITGADFGTAPSITNNYTIQIPANKIGGAIYLKFTYTNMSNGQTVTEYATNLYATTLTGTIAGPNTYNKPFYAAPGKIYWLFEGKWRWVLSWNTLEGLFDDYAVSTSIQIVHDTDPPGIIGEPLGPDNGLINDSSTGTLYFREGNYIRGFANPAAVAKYYFDWNIRVNVPNINGYVVGPAIL